MVLRFLQRWRIAPGRVVVSVAAYAFVILSLFALAAQATGRLAGMVAHLAPAWTTSAKPNVNPGDVRRAPAGAQKAAMSVPPARAQGSVVLTQGWSGYSSSSRERWRERDRDDDDWRWRDSDDEGNERHPQQSYGNTYRTVCVRLCDGYYWPISYATSTGHVERDRQKCESSCGSPARLYRSRTGAEVEDMEDLNGQPYSRLKTAFLYRTQYEPSCKCKAEPWSKEATDRHRIYALEAAKTKGDKVAAQELDRLKAERVAAQQQAQAARQTGGASTGQHALAEGGADAVPPTTAENQSASGKRTPAEGRMSLGARAASPPSRANNRPMRAWSDLSNNAP